MNSLVDSFVRMVHEHGVEMAVTLLVSGRRITGMLTANQRYMKWEDEILQRARHGGGGFTIPSLEVGDLSEDFWDEVRAHWPELEEKVYGGDNESGEGGFGVLCLRNAVVHEGRGDSAATEFPMLMLRADAVQGFMPGIHGWRE